MLPRVAKWCPLTSVSAGALQWAFCQKPARSRKQGLSGSVLPWDGRLGIRSKRSSAVPSPVCKGCSQAFCGLTGCRSVFCPREEVDKGISCLLWSCFWQTAALTGSVHIITDQDLAHVEGLSSENCFHVSCFWCLRDLQFSTAAQIPWLCSSPW